MHSPNARGPSSPNARGTPSSPNARGTPSCLASGPHENVVFTLGNVKYRHLIVPWSRRLHALSWHQQYFSALDSETAWHIEQSGADLCTIPFYSAPKAVSVKESTRLPTNVGLAKFATLQMLLERGHRTVTMTEMDVYWFADPRAEIEVVLSRRPIAAQENYPWEPHKANIGFVNARNEPRVLRLFADVTSSWAALTAKNGNLSRKVAADQAHLHRLLHSHNLSSGIYLDRGAVATLNLQERNGGTAVFHAGLQSDNYHSARVNWRGWVDVKGDDRPHAHFGGVLRVLHITGVSEELKLQLTQLLYFEATAMGTPNLTAADFCGMSWSDLIRRCSRLATKLHPGREASAGERRKFAQAGRLRRALGTTGTVAGTGASGAAQQAANSLVGSVASASSLVGSRRMPIVRGQMHVVPNFLSARELAKLRQHVLGDSAAATLKMTELRDAYARSKRLLDLGSKQVQRRIETPLLEAATAAFDRAHRLATSLNFSSEVFDTTAATGVGSARHISWHSTGSDFPPHVDYAPNCVAILVYLTDGDGSDFAGGALQTRGCPDLWQCPLIRDEYSLDTSERLACTVESEHTPRAGEMVALLAETAHAVTRVTSGTRVALNSWLNCPWSKELKGHKPKRSHRAAAALAACSAGGKASSRRYHERNLSSVGGIHHPATVDSAAAGAVTGSSAKSQPASDLVVTGKQQVQATGGPANATTKNGGKAPSPAKAGRCAAPLVFYVGLQKAGTSSFQLLASRLGYRAIKLANPGAPAYTQRDLETFAASRTGAFTSLFRTPRQPVAVSDFPIFALPCELSASYPNAKFVHFRRPFESWFESERADVLCTWMRSKGVGYNRGRYTQAMWQLGLDFMHFFWGEAFGLFWDRLEHDPTLCSATNRSSAVWGEIGKRFRAKFDEHRASVSRCLNATQLIELDLGANHAGAAVASFLGCQGSAHTADLPHTTGACKSCSRVVAA